MSNAMKVFTMIEFDQVREEACMSFVSPNTGDMRKLWINRDTLRKLVGIARWDVTKYGEPTLLQVELKTLMLREFQRIADIETWFDTTANSICRSKAQGTI